MDSRKVKLADDLHKFPVTKPQLCNNKPKFPFRDIRHYTDPCCDFPKQCQIGYTAQATLNELSSPISKNQSTEHATSQARREAAP